MADAGCIKITRQKRIVYKRAKPHQIPKIFGRATEIQLNNRIKKACNQARWEYLKQLSVKIANDGDSKLLSLAPD